MTSTNPDAPPVESPPAPEAEETDSVDLVLRHISQRFPTELARGLLRTEGPLTASVFETQVGSRSRRLDRTLDVRQGDERRLLHVEWQSLMPADMSFRVFEYQTLLSFAVVDERRSGAELTPPIGSVVVLLGGREEPWPEYGSYRLSSATEEFSGVKFRIEPVYQRTVAELSARGPFWQVFAPLAVDADASKVTRVMRDMRVEVSPTTFDELGVAMAVLAEADHRGRQLRNVVRSLLPRELVMQSWIYTEGLEAGIEKGNEKHIRSLALQFEHRLGRALTEPEQSSLRKRFQIEGADKVGNVVLDLSPQDLALWLAPSNGH